MPDIIELHTGKDTIDRWVEYATFDCEVTYWLYYNLKALMKELPVEFEDLKSIWDIYRNYWRPFGELLTDIEKRGIKVNREHLEVS